MLEPADICVIVEPVAPEHIFFADRVHRDLRDLGYATATSASYTATLKVAWTDADGWTLTYNNQAQTFTLKNPKCLERVLYEDRILAHQPNMPPGRRRPFSPPTSRE
jgi:hypothetical protein